MTADGNVLGMRVQSDTDVRHKVSAHTPIRPLTHQRRGRRPLFWLVPLFSAAILIIQPAGAALALTAPEVVPTVSSLHVVSEPIAAGNVVVVVNVTQAHTLELSAVDPANQKVIWQLPYSSSDITPGVWPEPVVADGVVIDLSPALGASDPDVAVEGVDAQTGNVAWRLPGNGIVDDVPLSCAKHDFCLAINTQSGNELEVVRASTGQPVRTIVGIERSMDGVGLYQTSSAAPTLEEVSVQGALAWTKTVKSYFGLGFTPDSGWDFDPRGALEVGTIGIADKGVNYSTGQIAPGGATENIGASESVGIRRSDGSLVWKDSGMYQCGGSLLFLATPVLCDFTGKIHLATQTAKPVFEGGSLVISGFDTKTGAKTWRQPVTDYQSVALGQTLPFLDGNHLVIQTAKNFEVLNVQTGSTANSPSGASYWCESSGTYTIVSSASDYAHGHREAAPTFGSCSAKGQTEMSGPQTQPTTVGVIAHGMFVWSSPGGLKAVRAVRP